MQYMSTGRSTTLDRLRLLFMELRHITSTLLVGGVWLFLVVQVPFFAEMSIVFGVINGVIALSGTGSWTGPMLAISLTMVVVGWLVVQARKKSDTKSAN